MKIDVFNKNQQFVCSFPTITSASKYYNVNHRTMSITVNKGYCNKYVYLIYNSKLD